MDYWEGIKDGFFLQLEELNKKFEKEYQAVKVAENNVYHAQE